MAYVRENDFRFAAMRARQFSYAGMEALLAKSERNLYSSYDVFLSHSIMDNEIVLGAKQILEEKGFSVYIDWIDDPLLDRRNVCRETADLIRNRMRRCKSLLYLHSTNATKSKWCPWELGYFDAFTHPARRVFIFPVAATDGTYRGQEYLELYDTVEITRVGDRSFRKDDLLVRDKYGAFKAWSAAT